MRAEFRIGPGDWKARIHVLIRQGARVTPKDAKRAFAEIRGVCRKRGRGRLIFCCARLTADDCGKEGGSESEPSKCEICRSDECEKGWKVHGRVRELCIRFCEVRLGWNDHGGSRGKGAPRLDFAMVSCPCFPVHTHPSCMVTHNVVIRYIRCAFKHPHPPPP